MYIKKTAQQPKYQITSLYPTHLQLMYLHHGPDFVMNMFFFLIQITAPACVLYFEVPDEVMVERLLGRAKTSGRVDDNEETIKKRLKTFHDHCDKVLEHYKTKGLLCQVSNMIYAPVAATYIYNIIIYI